MQFAAMLNPFTFVGSDIASQQQLEKTLRELYSSKPHITASLGIALAAVSAAMSGAVWSGIIATAVALACLLFRMLIERSFVARSSDALEPRWIRLFVIGSFLSGFGFGLSGAILLYGTSASTQVIIMGVGCAIVQGTAGRAYMIPGTAFVNITLILGMMGIAALADGNHLLAPAAVLYLFFLVSFISQMVNNRLVQLRAEQTAERLFQEITEKNELLRIANETLETRAYEDPLTGLANRRKFDLVLAESLMLSQQNQSAISLMMIDVDHFKSFNDTYGHQAGDECLQLLSRSIEATLSGSSGLVARYGGEEFVVILPGDNRAMAMMTAERIRLAVSLTGLDTLPNAPPVQSVSIGVVSCEGRSDTTRESMLAAADAALYEAKKQGRNRVCVFDGADENHSKALSLNAARLA